MQKAKIYKSEQQVKELIPECNELISIFVKSIDSSIKAEAYFLTRIIDFVEFRYAPAHT